MLTILAEFSWHFLFMLALLCASAFFSGSETALFNLSRDQLRRFRASRSAFQRLAARLMDDPRRLLVTVLFGNMTVNTAFFATSVMLIPDFERLDPARATLWRYAITIVAPLVVIVFGEVVPKAVAVTMPARLAPLAGPVLAVLERVVMPIRLVLGTVFIGPLERLITGPPRPRERTLLTTDELQEIVEVAAREGAVSPDESDMLTEVLELAETKVREVMVPRVEMTACDVATPTAQVLDRFRRAGHTKIVVYEDEIDQVRGVVYAKTAFLNATRPLAELVRPVHFVPVMKTVESLLKEFRARKIQFALVVDEYGGLAGLVTLEDCLEAIVGSIGDETDQPEPEPVRRVSDAEYLLDGDLSVRSWADLFEQDLPARAGRYATVAGLVTWLLGRVPRMGDSVRWRNLEFAVEEVRSRRVTRVRLRLLPEEPDAADEDDGREFYDYPDEDF